jgi:hypothetical protein
MRKIFRGDAAVEGGFLCFRIFLCRAKTQALLRSSGLSGGRAAAYSGSGDPLDAPMAGSSREKSMISADARIGEGISHCAGALLG